MEKDINAKKADIRVYDFHILFMDGHRQSIQGTNIREEGSFVTFIEEGGSAVIIATSQIKSIYQTEKKS